MVGPLVSNCCNDRLELAIDWMGSVSELLDFLNYLRNLFFCRSRFEDDYHERIAANNTSAAGGEWEKKTGDRRSEYRSQKSESRRRETALISANYGCEGPKPKKTGVR